MDKKRKAIRSVSFGLEPNDYLKMLKEEYAEFLKHHLSIRKAINCWNFSNALPEIIHAEYHRTAPEKVHFTPDYDKYRDYLRTQSEAHHTVRNLCDFSKHRILTERESLRVSDAAKTERSEPGHPIGLLLALTATKTVERLIVKFDDGRQEIIDDILREAIASWEKIFASDAL